MKIMKNKLKTKKAAYKRIKQKKNYFIRKKAYKSHFLIKKTRAQLRRLSLEVEINLNDKKTMFLMLPYR